MILVTRSKLPMEKIPCLSTENENAHKKYLVYSSRLVKKNLGVAWGCEQPFRIKLGSRFWDHFGVAKRKGLGTAAIRPDKALHKIPQETGTEQVRTPLSTDCRDQLLTRKVMYFFCAFVFSDDRCMTAVNRQGLAVLVCTLDV